MDSSPEKKFIPIPVEIVIGDEAQLEAEMKLELQQAVDELIASGFGLGAIVVMKSAKKKHETYEWGVVDRYYPNYPEINNQFKPFSVKWISGNHSGRADRPLPEDLFIIKEGLMPDEVAEWENV